jgi:hypothetical protein
MKKINWYHKLTLCMLLLLIGIGSSQAQMQLILNEPLDAQLNLNRIFSFQLVTGAPSTVQWKGEVYNGSALIASGESQLVTVAQGTQPFTQQTGSFVFTYKNTSKSSANGDLPFGDYRVCVKVSLVNNGIIEDVTEDCFTKEYTPLSPPYLVSPANEEEIQNPNPMLVWSPPMPILSGLKPVYKLKLVEVLSGQSCYDALQRNYALLESDNVLSTQVLYPLNAPALTPGSRYAWGISTRMGDYNFGNTEVWCFYYKKPVAEQAPDVSEPYIVVKPGINQGGYYTKEKKLYVQYDEVYNGKNFEFKLYDKANKDITKDCNIVLEKKQGDNRVVFDFSNCSALKKSTYRLEITNSKNDMSALFFNYE